MSTKVRLFFREFLSKEMEKKIKNYEMIRLMSWVSFRTYAGWSEPEKAIFDTGAPTSLIPFSMWQNLTLERIATHEIPGINPEPECKVPVVLAKAMSILLDKGGNQTKEMNIHTYLALINKVPLIIGFKDLLDHFAVHFNYPRNEAWVEELS